MGLLIVAVWLFSIFMGKENRKKEIAKPKDPKDKVELNEILKKLDILLGYFPKQESKEHTTPKGEINEEKSEDK
jgi:hypothetical protein